MYIAAGLPIVDALQASDALMTDVPRDAKVGLGASIELIPAQSRPDSLQIETAPLPDLE